MLQLHIYEGTDGSGASYLDDSKSFGNTLEHTSTRGQLRRRRLQPAAREGRYK